MKTGLVLAAVEYFSDQGSEWPVARLNAAIAVAVYALLNVLTLICLHYVIAGNSLGLVFSLDRKVLALGMATVGVLAWIISPSRKPDIAYDAGSDRAARRVRLKIYCISTLILFVMSVALVLARMAS